VYAQNRPGYAKQLFGDIGQRDDLVRLQPDKQLAVCR
jgi:hypothetical protein